MRAVLSIGSNMADSRALLHSVLAALTPGGAIPGRLLAASPIYATPAWGGVEQPDFLNATLVIDTPLGPEELLRAGQAVENAAQRTREVRWGPRTLDVDIVDYQDEPRSTQELTIPHPYAHARAFVLLPWLAAEPEARLNGQPLAIWLAALDESEVSQVRITDHFDEALLSAAKRGNGAAEELAAQQGPQPEAQREEPDHV